MPRLLIVEDERIAAAALEHQLARAGYEVVGNVGKADAAVTAAVEQAPDVVLMDINLGAGPDGIEAARQIRDRCRTAVIFLTAYSDEETLRRAQEVAPFGYLRKPVHSRDLQPALQMALARAALEREREELLASLQAAQAEIEVLRSFLPLCAWCRRVRNDEGYWEDLAHYVTRKLGGEVSHGICDSCATGFDEESGSAGPG